MNSHYGEARELKGKYPWRERKKLAIRMGMGLEEFWKCSPIEWWDYFRAHSPDKPESAGPMTLKRSEEIVTKITSLMEKKGRDINGD